MFDGFLTLPVLAVGAFFAVSYFVNPETIIIEEISVPLYLEYRGFNNEVATGLLTEEVAKIAHAATTNRGTMPAELTAQGRSVEEIGRAAGREIVCQYGWISGGRVALRKKKK